jgi:hypothetical protein
MLRKPLSILILVVFLAHFAGFYVYFAIQLQAVLQEMRAKLKNLPPEYLELIQLTLTDFEKAKVEEHEIKVEGKMYDIAWTETTADSASVYCLHDAAEDDLLAFLDKILSLPLKDKNAPAGVLQFLSLNYLPAYWMFMDPIFSATEANTAYTEVHSQFTYNPASPPPKS